MVPPPASMIRTWSPDCERVKQQTPDDDVVTYLEILNGFGVGGTKVETCLAFGQKVDTEVPGRSVWDNAGFDRGGSQSRLLWASPSVRMSQHQFDIIRDGVPSNVPVRDRAFE